MDYRTYNCSVLKLNLFVNLIIWNFLVLKQGGKKFSRIGIPSLQSDFRSLFCTCFEGETKLRFTFRFNFRTELDSTVHHVLKKSRISVCGTKVLQSPTVAFPQGTAQNPNSSAVRTLAFPKSVRRPWHLPSAENSISANSPLPCKPSTPRLGSLLSAACCCSTIYSLYW